MPTQFSQLFSLVRKLMAWEEVSTVSSQVAFLLGVGGGKLETDLGT
jgi:hypothetical protein